MSRSGYCEDGDYEYSNLWMASVERAMYGKRGQAFLKELAAAMDAMPEKKLIADELVTPEGEVCAIGVVCKSRGLNTEGVDIYDREEIGKLVGIAPSMAAEIEYYNDQYGRGDQTPEERWTRMRKWVEDQIVKQAQP